MTSNGAVLTCVESIAVSQTVFSTQAQSATEHYVNHTQTQLSIVV